MHCPQCGKPNPNGAVACPFCGAALAPPGASWAGAKPGARTIVGVAVGDVLRQHPATAAQAAAGDTGPVAQRHPPSFGAGGGARTIVGMPASAFASDPRASSPGLDAAPAEADPRLFGATLVVGTPAAAASLAAARAPAAASATMMGHPAPLSQGVPAAPPGAASKRAPPEGASRTLLGVARPGIAPLAPGVPRAPEAPAQPPPRYEPAAELGATIGPLHPNIQLRMAPERNRALMRPLRLPAVDARAARPAKRPAVSRRAVAVMIAGGVLAVGAVLFALLWPSAPPVTARARADAEGHEVVELRCESCPDGTGVSIGEGRAAIAGGVAQIPLATPLSVGENRMKVAIDRPGGGRDETVGVAINVAYRIRPDLGTLQGERPSIQIVVEASKGTQVTLDGKDVALANGRAIESVDVTDAITGTSDEPKTLSRAVSYVVTPPDGPREQGMVSVSVGIAPLHVDAPGPSVIIDKESFVLAGRTAKGAQLFAGPHPITVRPDGTFAHVMNVSSVGATQFEVRAKMPGTAPRIAKIAVRRVDRIETAVKEFAARSPIGFAELAAGSSEQVGKPIALSGEVLEARRQGYATLMLLSVAKSSGCKAAEPSAGAPREAARGAKPPADPAAPSPPAPCAVRLVHGAENPAQRGDVITAYGVVAPPFVAPGGAAVPEVQVEFTVKGAR